jgi:hypothetical protein
MRVDQLRQRLIRLREPAPRRDAVRHVRESLGEDPREFAEELAFHQLRMELRNAVDLLARDDRQVRHAHAPLPVFIDERHAANDVDVMPEMLARVLQETRIDLEDDFEVPRQQAREHIDVPRFERLGHQRVVRIGKHLLRHLPRAVPRHVMDVDEQAHELGNREHGVRIVQMDRDFLGEAPEGAVRALIAANEILHRRGHEEVLLTQP